MNVDELNEKFGVEGEIGFAELEGDLAFAMISNKYADANICLYGAHITEFRPQRTMEVLWMSPDSYFQEGKAIRGGIPVCFPWFGPHETDPTQPQHGFGRLMYWTVVETKVLSNGESLLKLRLNSSDKTKNYWPFDFCAEMEFVIGEELRVTLEVKNTSDTNIQYSAALHSYFNLSSIENIRIEGLEGISYNDQLDGNNYTQEDKLLAVGEEITRHYYNTDKECFIHDPVFGRSIKVGKEGSTNTTVWNPWAETCRQMGDMPDDGYETFVCLETVNKIDNIIELAPNMSHKTTAIIGVR